MSAKYEYSIIPGFFVQDDHKYSEYDQIIPAFGLKDHASPTRWKDFRERIDMLRQERKGERLVVFFVARHGQGWHNVGSEKYGRPEWETSWAFKNGDGEIVWGPDPELTPQGISEAGNMNRAWKKELAEGMPMPFRWFASPFRRACHTLHITFEGIAAPTPLIIEEIREMIGKHTCDKRSPKRTIRERYPHFDIEEGFAEEDELWKPDYRETDQEMVVRARRGLDKIMGIISDDDTYVSITAHTGIARALMAAVGHRRYDLPTGGVLPMVVAVRTLPSA